MLGLRSLLRFLSRWRNKLLYGQEEFPELIMLNGENEPCWTAFFLDGVSAQVFAKKEPLLRRKATNDFFLLVIGDDEMRDSFVVGKCFSRNDLSGMVGFVSELQSNPDYHNRLKNNTINAAGDFTEENAMRFVTDVR
jgi:hypothetical protein